MSWPHDGPLSGQGGFERLPSCRGRTGRRRTRSPLFCTFQNRTASPLEFQFLGRAVALPPETPAAGVLMKLRRPSRGAVPGAPAHCRLPFRKAVGSTRKNLLIVPVVPFERGRDIQVVGAALCAGPAVEALPDFSIFRRKLGERWGPEGGGSAGTSVRRCGCRSPRNRADSSRRRGRSRPADFCDRFQSLSGAPRPVPAASGGNRRNSSNSHSR